jgi:hypothetical protein
MRRLQTPGRLPGVLFFGRREVIRTRVMCTFLARARGRARSAVSAGCEVRGGPQGRNYRYVDDLEARSE